MLEQTEKVGVYVVITAFDDYRRGDVLDDVAIIKDIINSGRADYIRRTI